MVAVCVLFLDAAIALFVTCGDVVAADRPGVVISFSHSAPDTAYWRRFASDMERRPFDGVAFEIDPRDSTWVDKSYWQEQIDWARSRSPDYDYLAEMYLRPRQEGSISWGGGAGLTHSSVTGPWNPANHYTDVALARALADLRSADARRFRFNLLSVGIASPTTDWLSDEDFAQRIRNFATLARFARDAGLKGFLFDDEQYGSGCAWNYRILRRRGVTHGQSFEAMRAKAQQRGRAFGQAISSEFPSIVFWTLHGYSTAASLVEQGLPEYAMDLKAGFYDGLLEGAGDRLTFVDGGELAYGFNRREHFEHGRRMVKEAPIAIGLTKVPDLHRARVKCAFGLWPDYYNAINPDDPEQSYFSPGRFQRALSRALELSDGYVWIRSQMWSWWVEGVDGKTAVPLHQGRRGLPNEYWRAVEAARMSPGEDTSDVRRLPTVMLPGNGRNRVVEGEALKELLQRSEKVAQLPTAGWKFKLDDWGVFSDDLATFDHTLSIGSSWRDQGVSGTDSIGWYRARFTLPAALAGRKLHFYLPEVAGSVWLFSASCARPQTMAWRYVVSEPSDQRRPFVLTHPRFSSLFFEPGKPAEVVIKVMRHSPTGGILAPIQVLAEE